MWRRSRPDEESVNRQRVLAVASGGGHWVQLLRITPAFSEHDLAFITTIESCQPDVGSARFYVVNDASRWNKWGLLRMGLRVAWIMAKERPDVVVSTGAAPGFFAVRLGKLLGARTVWVDSMANVEQLSLSGQKIRRHADLWLTQWPHLANPDGPYFSGAVL
jgi:UDP-N-acetylglucosamine:LPS N-acetylglucosamine transferase